jgi:exonuclease III
MSRLLTVEQAVTEFNLPSARTIRTLRKQGLPTVKLGAARLIDYDDMMAFIEAAKETPCQDQTPARGSSRSKGARASTSPGSSKGGSGFAQLALRSAEQLKRRSQNSSANDSEDQGRVIRAKFS